MVGNKHYKKKTTAGWELKVEWKGRLTSWITLKSLKETNPVEVAEYAWDNKIDEKPAFDWWVHYILWKKDHMIKASHRVHHWQGYKYGIKISMTLSEALSIDEEDGNTFWCDAVDKEMHDVMVAFDIQEEGAKPPSGHKCIPLHLVFDVKMNLLPLESKASSWGTSD